MADRVRLSSLVVKKGRWCWGKRDGGMESVKTRTTVGSHSPVYTSPWLPWILTSVWAVFVAHRLNISGQTHTTHAVRSAHKHLPVMQTAVNKILTVLFMHTCTRLHTYICMQGCLLRSRFDRNIWWVTCGEYTCCCWNCKNLHLFPHDLLIFFSDSGQVTCPT